jgi:virulence-associated protein VapD
MDIHSFTPVSATSIKESLKDAHKGMRTHCIYSTIDIILPKYKKYVMGRFWFSKRKNIIEWLLQEVSDGWGYKLTRYRDIANGNDYEGFIKTTLANCEFSSNGSLYMSDEAMRDYRHVLYCISNKDHLNTIKKSQENNKVLWDLYEANWRVIK